MQRKKKFAAEQIEGCWHKHCWSVIDTTLPDDSNLVYEEFTEFEAKTVTEILNDSDVYLTFDQVCADWRWAVLERIEELEAQCQHIAEAYLSWP